MEVDLVAHSIGWLSLGYRLFNLQIDGRLQPHLYGLDGKQPFPALLPAGHGHRVPRRARSVSRRRDGDDHLDRRLRGEIRVRELRADGAHIGERRRRVSPVVDASGRPGGPRGALRGHLAAACVLRGRILDLHPVPLDVRVRNGNGPGQPRLPLGASGVRDGRPHSAVADVGKDVVDDDVVEVNIARIHHGQPILRGLAGLDEADGRRGQEVRVLRPLDLLGHRHRGGVDDVEIGRALAEHVVGSPVAVEVLRVGHGAAHGGVAIGELAHRAFLARGRDLRVVGVTAGLHLPDLALEDEPSPLSVRQFRPRERKLDELPFAPGGVRLPRAGVDLQARGGNRRRVAHYRRAFDVGHAAGKKIRYDGADGAVRRIVRHIHSEGDVAVGRLGASREDQLAQIQERPFVRHSDPRAGGVPREGYLAPGVGRVLRSRGEAVLDSDPVLRGPGLVVAV